MHQCSHERTTVSLQPPHRVRRYSDPAFGYYAANDGPAHPTHPLALRPPPRTGWRTARRIAWILLGSAATAALVWAATTSIQEVVETRDARVISIESRLNVMDARLRAIEGNQPGPGLEARLQRLEARMRP